MKIVHIFGPADYPEEGLWSLESENGQTNEFKAIFDIWQDAQEMFMFCQENLADMQEKYGYNITAEEAANELMDEADALLELLYSLGKTDDPGKNLQQVFKPLNDNDTSLTVLQPSKGTIKNKFFKDPKLRIYAVRIAENTFVVTGGAIKITHKMNERKHTRIQYERLIKARDWLREYDIGYPEDLNELT